MAKVDDFAWSAPKFLQNNSLKALKSLPGFKKEQSKIEPNIYNPEEEIIFSTCFYSGLEIYGYLKDAKLHPISVKVSGPQWKLAHDISVGKSFDSVVAVIGEPNTKAGGIATYQGQSETIKFHLEGGVITRIEFYYYAG